MLETWVGGPKDVREGEEAILALRAQNDAEYIDAEGGIRNVPEHRWLAAQEFERSLWMDVLPYAQSDRCEEHAAKFASYESIPNGLGDVLEVGCGPFTQTAYILGTKRTARSITLLDPLITHYINHPHCPYAKNLLKGIKASLLSLPLEELPDKSYDTVICINVMEHVKNADGCIKKLNAAVRQGGTLIFHERSWDEYDPKILYDVGHPIRILEADIYNLLLNYQPTHHDVERYECGHIHYFIGIKK